MVATESQSLTLLAAAYAHRTAVLADTDEELALETLADADLSARALELLRIRGEAQAELESARAQARQAWARGEERRATNRLTRARMKPRKSRRWQR